MPTVALNIKFSVKGLADKPLEDTAQAKSAAELVASKWLTLEEYHYDDNGVIGYLDGYGKVLVKLAPNS